MCFAIGRIIHYFKSIVLLLSSLIRFHRPVWILVQWRVYIGLMVRSGKHKLTQRHWLQVLSHRPGHTIVKHIGRNYLVRTEILCQLTRRYRSCYRTIVNQLLFCIPFLHWSIPKMKALKLIRLFHQLIKRTPTNQIHPTKTFSHQLCTTLTTNAIQSRICQCLASRKCAPIILCTRAIGITLQLLCHICGSNSSLRVSSLTCKASSLADCLPI